MSQEMNILCCYSCKMYQVHIVKKARKWQCKLCGEKQSVKQIYFQGSGKDCRLHVQRLNSLKTNELFSAVVSEQDVSNTHYNTSLNVSEMSGSDKVIESKWTKYLDSPKKKQPSDTEDSSSEDICQTENVISGEEFLHNDGNNASCNFDQIIDDSDFEIEDVAEDHEKDPSSISCDKNSGIDQSDNLQDNIKSSKDHSNVTNIFETYDELDDPLDF
ncbi:MRN complex-interacting protein isoform X1 [Odontomachus brunneus]|uniref:MRN complex-interacting protein isoform X1 n=1 Tax=Odontomachus brunneus TaxID=486640 RepID=UPI0013F1DE43|nr:MRN complex-interacting protein isoform X1 [Odontomachus brunneus]XP_032685662.1 MRN complex-interacting protein isoform X1 [Odontomachus brunneus]XP_032685671.1 MRN complex-interacting protein isoform X1 [Odontomachus brunneus]